MTEIEKLQIKNEGLFYRSCKKLKNLEFVKGHRSPTSGKEKGVDVALASDMVRYACERKFGVGYLLTGDADFQRCVEIAIDKKRIIKLLALENRIAFGMAVNFETWVVSYKARPVYKGKCRIKVIKGDVKRDIVKIG